MGICGGNKLRVRGSVIKGTGFSWVRVHGLVICVQGYGVSDCLNKSYRLRFD